MEKVMAAIKLVIEHGPEILGALMALLSGVIAVSLLIPGEQPEKALKSVVAFLEKLSRK